MAELERPAAHGKLVAIRGLLDVTATALVIVVAVMVIVRLTSGAHPQASPTKASQAGTRREEPLPSDPLPLANAALTGDLTAKVAIIEFSDFQCPYCRTFALGVWPELQRQYVDTGKVLFAFRHMPLDSIHPRARALAEAAECARRQDNFWQFHDGFFQRQKELVDLDLVEFASDVGVARASLVKCLDGEASAAVAADETMGRVFGVAGTPTFFIGRVDGERQGVVTVTGRLSGARPLQDFARAIDVALSAEKEM